MELKNFFHRLELCFEKLWNKSSYVGVKNLQSNKLHNLIQFWKKLVFPFGSFGNFCHFDVVLVKHVKHKDFQMMWTKHEKKLGLVLSPNMEHKNQW
jgi:hypothetical protein